jgi:transcriptional regulator with XRE-family HTH domain
MLGVSQSQYSKYERGETEPSLSVLVKLCERFERSLDWLVLGREPSTKGTLITIAASQP